MRTNSYVKIMIFCTCLVGILSRGAQAGDCKDGCVRLCNKTTNDVEIATAHLKGNNRFSLECAMSGKECHVVTEGWWTLKPGQCYQPNAAVWWQTYYSIVKISPNGDWSYPSWDIDQAVLDGTKDKGMSGYSGHSICVDKHHRFSRKTPGKYSAAFNEKCPSGYDKSPVNLFTQGSVNYRLNYSIK